MTIFPALLLLLATLASLTESSLVNFPPKNSLVSEPPPTPDNCPVKVEVSLYVISLSQLDQSESGSFRAQMYLRQRWIDPRLTNNSEYLDSLNGHSFLGGEAVHLRERDIQDKIWTPDTFISDARSLVHHKLVSNSRREAEFCRVDRNTGEVYISKMLDLTASCWMSFAYFPFDQQKCYIQFESYGFSATNIFYHWAEPKDKAIRFGIPKFSVTDGFRLMNFDVSDEIHRVSTGNYSRAIVEFNLERKYSRYLATLYLPTLLLVALTWIPMRSSSVSGKSGFNNQMIFLAVLLVGFCVIATGHWSTVPFTSTSGSMTKADHFLLESLLLLLLAFVSTARRHFLFQRADSGSQMLPSYSDTVKIDLNGKNGDKTNSDKEKTAAVEGKVFGNINFGPFNCFFLPLSALIVYSFHFVEINLYM